MLNPKEIAEVEQQMARQREVWPTLWRNMFDGCIEQGFTEQQALDLVKTYTTALISNTRGA